MTQILLSTIGTWGDVQPFLILGEALHKRGHKVILATHCHYREKCRQAGLGFLALDTPDEFEAFTYHGDLLNSTRGTVSFLQMHVMPKIYSHYEIISQACTDKTVIVSRATPGIAERLSAEKLGLPFISILMAPHHLTSNAIVEELLSSVFNSRINKTRTLIGLPPLKDWSAWWRAPDLSLGLWPEWFSALPTPQPERTLLTGFLWQPENAQTNLPSGIKEILDDHKAPILITGGTGMFGGKAFYTVSAEACKYLHRQAILVNRLPELTPDHLPPNVHRFEYIQSLGNYIPKMVTVVHHGGLITLSQALYAGISQVILAIGGDRPENATYAQNLGVARYLPRSGWDAKTVAHALEEMIASDAVQQCCQQVAEWYKSSDAIGNACNAIEKIMQNNKPQQNLMKSMLSNKSPEFLPVAEGHTGQSKKQALTSRLSPELQALLAARLRKKAKGL